LAGEACQRCGFLPQRAPKPVAFRDGDLARVDRGQRTAQTISDPAEHVRWHAMLTHIAGEHGYKSGWVSHKFREKFGMWPAVRHIRPIEPSPEVLSWVRSRIIAFAKTRGTAA
jgi:DNA repair protein RadD